MLRSKLSWCGEEEGIFEKAGIKMLGHETMVRL